MFLTNSALTTASAIALLENTDLNAEEIVLKSMKIAGDMCVYTNHNLTVEKVEAAKDASYITK